MLNYFSDDEHTATDGPYARLLKSRKWLWLSSVLAIAAGHHRIVAVRIEDVLQGVLRIDASVIFWATFVPLVVSTIQYALILWQNVATYDLTIQARFQKRQSEAIDLATSEAASAGSDVEEAYALLAEARKRHARSFEAISSDYREISDLSLVGTDSSAKNAYYVEQVRNAQLDVEAAQRKATLARKQLRTLVDAEPSERLGMKASEIGLDALRVFPPLAFAGVAWFALFIT